MTSVGARGPCGVRVLLSIWMSRDWWGCGWGGGPEELRVVRVNLAEHVKESVRINKCPHVSRAPTPPPPARNRNMGVRTKSERYASATESFKKAGRNFSLRRKRIVTSKDNI